MIISGKDFWALRATHGIPWDLIVDYTSEMGIYPAWDEVLREAWADGALLSKVIDTFKMLYAGKPGGDHIAIGLTKLHERMVAAGELPE